MAMNELIDFNLNLCSADVFNKSGDEFATT